MRSERREPQLRISDLHQSRDFSTSIVGVVGPDRLPPIASTKDIAALSEGHCCERDQTSVEPRSPERSLNRFREVLSDVWSAGLVEHWGECKSAPALPALINAILQF